jgi:hypothetical protein
MNSNNEAMEFVDKKIHSFDKRIEELVAENENEEDWDIPLYKKGILLETIAYDDRSV